MKSRFLALLAAAALCSAHGQTMVTTNSVWKYVKGTAEASSPTTAWRSASYNDAAWLTGQEPFYFENDPGSGTAYTGNTVLADMYNSYTCIFMRQNFVVTNLAQVAQLRMTALCDDGFIAWINGVEVARFNMPAGTVAYNGASLGALSEPVPVQTFSLFDPHSYLVTGTNVLAIQAFNTSKTSSDFVIWAGLVGLDTATWNNVGISEFMATNQATALDEDGEASPWIELYNPTTSDISLNGWALTDDTNNLTQWKFPNVTLPCRDNANGSDNFMVVFASGKNRAVNTNELHTNFRLRANGGYLALVNASSNIVSVFNYPTQQVDVAYGRDLVNPNNIGYFPKPTPGDANVFKGANFAPAVDFSRPSSTFVPAFNLQLSTTNPAAAIYYTLDGSIPTTNATVYTAPLAITNSAQVRARAFADGAGLMPGPIGGETYLQIDAGLVNTNSDLPAIIIYNFGAGGVPDGSDQLASIFVCETNNGITRLTNPPTMTARSTIHIHGTTSTWYAKKSYSVGFCDALGNDDNYSPLGLPAESSFILYAPDYFEPVLLHNPLIYQLSNEIGRYAPRTRYCEVYLNTAGGKIMAADYNGIYVLEEKIKWDASRVNIKKAHSVDNLNPKDNSYPNLTGGYMMKIDWGTTGETGFSSAGQTIQYNYPKEPDIKTPQRAPQKQYLQSYMDAFGAALNGTNYANPTNGFRAYIDQPAWIDHHILNVMAFNVDALKLSAYFYKDRTNSLVFGPIWDFDRAEGSRDGRDFNPRYWRSPMPDYGTDYFNGFWWGRMFTDIDFWQAWIDRYADLRETFCSTNHIYATIDALVAQVQQEQPREAARWPSLTAPRSGTVTVTNYSYTFPGTYAGEVAFLKQWYADRLQFMDTNFLAKPALSGNGAITPGFTLTLTGPAGATLYYTTNGVDPRAPGGGVAASAQVYTSPVTLVTNVTVLARAYDVNHHNLTGANKPPLSSPWSGLASKSYIPASAPVITQSPASLDAYLGQAPVFTVLANGIPAPTYQWQLNGTDLPGETNSQLTVPITDTNQAGVYDVTVANLAGSTNAAFTLNVTAKPRLVITEAMSSEVKGTLTTSDWWELSNLVNFAVNLQGYRFNDDHYAFTSVETITNAATIAPGESIVLVQDLPPAVFRAWWGPQNLPAQLQVLTYANIGFGASSDAIYLWNAAANTLTDTVASVTFATATRGVSFGYNPAAQTFGELSATGQHGAFVAAMNGDIGSPGTLFSPPQITTATFNSGTDFSLNFATLTNLNYSVECKDHLTDANWMVVTSFTATASTFVFADPTAGTNAARFYRITVKP